MELEEIKQLLELIASSDITEFQIERDGVKLKVKRERFTPVYEVPQPVKQAPPTVPAEEAGETQKLVTVTSPIVGIFHRAPSPESPPYVDIGTEVKKGQVLCIVEAMKLMNEIESDADGLISKILVENGQPVEYGEPLFLIEPTS